MATVEAWASLSPSMRELWVRHMLWSRQYLVAVVSGTPDRSKAADRLLDVQEQLGIALAPYLGEVICARLAALLKERVLLTGHLLFALKVWDSAEAQRQWQALRTNAKAVGSRLSTANPSAPWRELAEGLECLDMLTYQQADARLRGVWDEDARACNEALAVAMAVADLLAEDIARRSRRGLLERAPRRIWFLRRRSGNGKSGSGAEPQQRHRGAAAS